MESMILKLFFSSKTLTLSL